MENVELPGNGQGKPVEAKKVRERKKPRKKQLKPGSVDGRPRIPFNWTQFDALCQIHCTQEEIASVMNVSMDTIERRCNEERDGKTFAECRAEKSASGKMSLRRAQFEMALGRKAEYDGEGRLIRPAQLPDKTMLIFLGKNILNQKNVWDVEGTVNVNTPASDNPYRELAELVLTHGTGLADILAEQGIDLGGTKVETTVPGRKNGSNGRGNGKASNPSA